ncbi:BON domain-containing protein [Dyella jiangningensis]|nr:BON domain-containing protein [Dyella jiangningensis]
MNRDHRPRDYRDTYGSDQEYEARRNREESTWPRRQGSGQLTEDVYAGARNDQGFGSFGRPFGELYERDDPSSSWSYQRDNRWHSEEPRGRARQMQGGRRQQPWGTRHTSYYDDELSNAPFDEEDTSGYAQGYAGFGQPPRRPWPSPGGYGPWASQGARPRSRYQEQGEHRGKGPMGYRRSDERIRDDVCEALTLDPWLDATHIQVNVDGGVVTLQGTVSDRHMKYRAEECADQASGVQDVENRIRVAGAGTTSESLVNPSPTRSSDDPLLSR